MKRIQIEDANYPEKLKKIKNAPNQLYLMGNREILNNQSIAIIGSRNCTSKGYETARKFAYDLASMGICVVSGMAEGIDTAAHIGALEAKGKTIAVLGSGFNHIFPERNKKLFKKILSSNGAIITEYEEDIEVFSQGFVMRNRIVSGISDAVLVVEAKKKSGTSITARFAKEQDKKIFCIAHGIESPEGMGTNRLIKAGAFLVTEVQDIVKNMNFKISKGVNNKIVKEILDVPKEYLSVYKFISEEPINIDELCKKSNLEMQKVNYILTMLELEGLITQLPGKMFKK